MFRETLKYLSYDIGRVSRIVSEIQRIISLKSSVFSTRCRLASPVEIMDEL